MAEKLDLEALERNLLRGIVRIDPEVQLAMIARIRELERASSVEQARDLELDMYRTFYGTLAPTEAVTDVLAERRRQVTAEGWTPEHDDEHTEGEMALAASCYASVAGGYAKGKMPPWWPWSADWWKPAYGRRDLIKAGALILAEIERIDRAALRSSKEAAAK